MNRYIPYSRQTIDTKDIKHVTSALRRDLITTGSLTNEFEKNFSKKTNVNFSVSCNSGTSAIHLALDAINLKSKDKVVIPAINFPAAANISKLYDAQIFFADVNPITGQMEPKNLEECIKKNNIKKLKVFFVMHNGGHSNYSKDFFKLKKKYNCYCIEDACHALGAKYSKDKKDTIGNCRYSDITTFSFHPLKSITTGEGGMVSTNKKNFYIHMLKKRNHGFELKKNKKNNYNWKHVLNNTGFNFRLNDFQCALGISQLNKLEKFIKERNNIAKIYLKKLNALNDYIDLPKNNKFYSAWHLFIINFKLDKLKISREKIIQQLYKSKILTQVHYIPNYRHKPFLIKKFGKFPGAEKYFSSCLSIPIYPNLKSRDLSYIIKNLRKILKKYKKN